MTSITPSLHSYTARVSAKWLKVGALPCPPGHGSMEYDVGAVEDTGD